MTDRKILEHAHFDRHFQILVSGGKYHVHYKYSS
jgi:hypothetical protein